MAAPARYRFTAEEYEQMGEAGILHEGSQVELIDGAIVERARSAEEVRALAIPSLVVNVDEIFA